MFVLSMFINIQPSEEHIQLDTNKMMTYEIFTVNDENNLTQSELVVQTNIASVKPFSVLLYHRKVGRKGCFSVKIFLGI